MIIVDLKRGSIELKPELERLGMKTERADLQFGDFAFEGNGPDGIISIGIERKTLHDMLSCIDDARYSGHQRIGMKNMYTLSVLMLEGHWKPHDGSGLLMEGFSGGLSYGYCKHNNSRVAYSKLKRYLFSVALSGVLVDYSRDPFHTAFNVAEWFHYFQKPWRLHTALRELPKVAIPTLNQRPSLVRKWAFDIDGVGEKLSEIAAQRFKTPIHLAMADEREWLAIPGVGVKSAQQIVRDVNGYRR